MSQFSGFVIYETIYLLTKKFPRGTQRQFPPKCIEKSFEA